MGKPTALLLFVLFALGQRTVCQEPLSVQNETISDAFNGTLATDSVTNVTQTSTTVGSSPRTTIRTTYTPKTRAPKRKTTPSPDSSAAALDEDAVIIEKWKNLVTQSKETIDSVVRRALPMFIRLTSGATLSFDCQASFLDMVVSLRNMKEWAIKMVDSSGKIPSGVIRGTLAEFGDFDECLDIRVDTMSGEEKFTGQYCLAIFQPQLPKRRTLDLNNITDEDSVFRSFQSRIKYMELMMFRTGMCIPSTCTNKDIESVLQAAVKDYPLTASVPKCEVRSPISLDWLQILIIVVFVILGAVILVATIVDLTYKTPEHPSSFYVFLMHFSAHSNAKKLMKTRTKKKTFRALNGIKCICIAWIVLDHSYVYATRFNLGRTINNLVFLEDPLYATIWNSWATVDTFFVIGGFLLSYLTLKYLMKKNGKISWVGFYLRRIWRLLPAVLFALALVMLLPLFGNGPMWEEVAQREVDVCRRNWWSLLLFVNSWLDYYDMCMVHSWFISNDIHFYAVSPLFLILLYKRPKLGVLAILSTILASIIALGSLTYQYELTIVVPRSFQEALKYKELLEKTYFKPYAHLAPYFVGLLLGFIVTKFEKIELKRVYVILGWVLSFLLGATTLYSIAHWGQDISVPLESAVAYHALYRLSWSLAIAWLVFACHYGYAGFVSRILSWSWFVPLNRLVFMIYLTHLPIIWLRHGSRKHVVPMEHVEPIYDFLSTMVLSVAFSALAYLAVEAPFASLDSAIFATVAATRMEKRLSEKRASELQQHFSQLDSAHVDGITCLDGSAPNGVEERGHSFLPAIRRKSKEFTEAFSNVFVIEGPKPEAEEHAARLMELRRKYKEWKPRSSFI